MLTRPTVRGRTAHRRSHYQPTKSAAAQLGHSSEEITETYYIAKPVQAPDVSGILERLGANRNGPQPRTARNDAHR
ncbi:integrase [Micromonospora sp. BQ11]|uniref:integrase n=1 Tax=Micromonospora sp. BQ11 TaxID=3452212 RepID=UPI003F8A298A